MQLSGIDWVIIVAYFVVVIAIGIAFSRRAGANLSEYFVSGRSLPWWIAGTSMVATTFAADTPLVVVSMVAKDGLAGNWFWWAFALGGMFTVFVYARLWRRSEVMTDVELIGIRYSGTPAKALRYSRAIYVALVVNPIIIGWVVAAMLLVLEQTVFWDPGLAADAPPSSGSWMVLVGLLAIVGLYCTLSGMWGVSITDAVQFIVAMVGCIWLAVASVRHVGGISGMQEKIAQNIGADAQQVYNFLPNFSVQDPWMPLHVFLILIGIHWWATWFPGAEPGGGGYVVQRMAACKNETHAFLATLWYQIAHYCLRPWPWLIVAFVALAMFPDLRNFSDPGIGFPMVMREVCGPGLRGLMLVTFFAAFMSTISTQMNWGASYLVRDFIQPVFAANATDHELTRYSKLASIAVLLVGGGVAVWMKLSGVSIESAWKMLAALGAGTGAVFMLRWFWWRINAWTEIVAMFSSLAYYLILNGINLKQDDGSRWLRDQELMAIVAGLTIATWLVVTFVTPPEKMETLRAFYRKIRPGGIGWKPVAALEPDIRPDGDLVRRIIAALFASGIVYFILPAVGLIVFGKTLTAAYCLAGALACGIVVMLVMWKSSGRSGSDE